MLLEVLVGLALGILSGIFSGLIPGIHVNLVSVLLVSFSAVLLPYTSPIVLAVFIISLAITHTFLDAIPSIYLGAPTDALALNVLPGHRLLLKGLAHNAIMYTVIGALGSLLLSILLFPIFIFSMEKLSSLVTAIVGYLLIGVMAYMILKDKGKRVKALVVFLLSGALGLLVFSIPNLKQPLFPLLSGLFGFSILIESLRQKSVIPKQKSAPLSLSKKNLVKSVSAASGMGFVAAFLPGFGSAQAAIIATEAVGDIGDEGFLTLVGGLNTVSMAISIAAAYILQKARNGAIVAVNELMGSVGFKEMVLFMGVALAAGGIAALLTIYLSKIFAKYIVKIDYTNLLLGIIIFITLLTLYFDGFIGFTILLTATAIGLVTTTFVVGKNHLMGCLILPVILYFVL